MKPRLPGPLFDGNAFRQVAWFIDVAARLDGHVAGQKLERDYGQDGADVITNCRDGDDVVGDFGEVTGDGARRQGEG